MGIENQTYQKIEMIIIDDGSTDYTGNKIDKMVSEDKRIKVIHIGGNENMSELLSVIVPVYQTKEYLPICIESILNQNYQNIEIILVDDGSSDGSAELCDDMKKMDKRIKVIHSQNRGLYQARKLGVLNAMGHLITFVDSDDWIEKNIYQDMMWAYDEYKPDIIAYAYRINEFGICSECFYSEGYYSKNEIVSKIIPDMIMNYQYGARKLNPSVCCKIFKKEIYKKVTENIKGRITLGEDAMVTYPAMCVAESVYISNRPYYHYRMNEKSSTHVFPLERIEEIEMFQKGITELMKLHGSNYDFSLQIDCYVRHLLEMFIVNRYGIHRTATMYVFPYRQIDPNSKVQIYGAGEVGKSYYLSLKQTQYAEVIGWYDKSANEMNTYDGQEILAPESIIEKDADKIIIAICDCQAASDISEYLLSLGIDEKKIFWKQPVLNI